MICHHEASSAIINNLPCSLSRAFLAVHLTQKYFLCLETHATITSLVQLSRWQKTMNVLVKIGQISLQKD